MTRGGGGGPCRNALLKSTNQYSAFSLSLSLGTQQRRAPTRACEHKPVLVASGFWYQRRVALRETGARVEAAAWEWGLGESSEDRQRRKARTLEELGRRVRRRAAKRVQLVRAEVVAEPEVGQLRAHALSAVHRTSNASAISINNDARHSSMNNNIFTSLLCRMRAYSRVLYYRDVNRSKLF